MTGRRLRTGLWLALLLSWSSMLFADPPNVTHLFPAGAQQGTTCRVRCGGEFSWPLEVWSSHGAVTVGEEEGTISIEVPPDFQSDRIWLRFYDKDGATSPIPFLVGQLPETAEVEPNDAPQTSQKLSEFASPPNDANLVINGVLQKKGDVDAFAVELLEGQTLVAAVEANTAFGSPIDSILQVVTPDGIVLAENHDHVGLDPRLAFVCKTSGTHIVRVFAFPSAPNQRIEFYGDKAAVYRLTLTTKPFVTHTVPSLVHRAANGRLHPRSVKVRGWNVPRGIRLPVIDNGDEGLVRAAGWAGMARIGFVEYPVATWELKPSKKSPQRLSVPCAMFGRLRTADAKDSFELALPKGNPISIKIDSLHMDSPLVPLVKLFAQSGEVVAETSIAGPAKDAVLSHTPKENGNYQLTIQDRFNEGGEDHFYRLTVEPFRTDFELNVDRDSLVLNREEGLELPVTINRTTGAEPAIEEILVDAVDLPAGVKCEAAKSAKEGDSSSKVTLKLEATGEPWSGFIRVRGSAGERSRIARTPERFRARFDEIWLTVQ